MYVSHINITMPAGEDHKARFFYSDCLGLRELPRPLAARKGGLELHISVEERRESDAHRHFGLGCGDLETLRAKLEAAGVRIEDTRQEPWNRFFVHDPFGNRIEIHAPGLRV